MSIISMTKKSTPRFTRKTYTGEEKRFLTEQAQAMRSQDISWTRITSELGTCEQNLRRWAHEFCDTKVRDHFQPVIAEETNTCDRTFTFKLPTGASIEGLYLNELPVLIKDLM